MQIETPINIFKEIDALASSFFGLIKDVEIDVENAIFCCWWRRRKEVDQIVIREFFRVFSTRK